MNFRSFLFGFPLIVCLVICPAVYLAVHSSVAASQTVSGNCVDAPELPLTGITIVRVSSADELNRVVNRAQPNTTILLEPGTYHLNATVSVTTDNLTIRGLENRCDKVMLFGKGMDEKNHQGVTSGFWINAKNATIANLTVGDFYYHPIQISGNSEAPRIYNVRMINAGQQFVKSNPKPSGEGVHYGIVEYSVLEYTNGTPVTDHDGAGTGYGNGVDVHGGVGWQIRHNRFLNTHTPDGVDHEWNAAVLVWRGSRDTITENNLFIDVDRAIAYGLSNRGRISDHTGGIIRNNRIVMSPALYSVRRRWKADAPIIVWDSPGTTVLHNSILTNGNTPFSIEARFDSTDIRISNNLADAPIVYSPDKINREACKYTMRCKEYVSTYAKNNEIAAKKAWFLEPEIGDFRLHGRALPLTRTVPRYPEAAIDSVGRMRPENATPGALQLR